MTDSAHLSIARNLIQVFSGITSTEDLVIFVAGTDRMLTFCQELIDQYDRDTRSPLVQDVGTICSARGVLPGIFFAEIRKVLLALNRHHDAGRDQYAVLDLKSDASVAEIKNAYRRLSKEHHPDSNRNPDNGKRFMEIAGAYHALMIGLGKRQAEGNVSWRKKTGTGTGRSRRKEQKYFLTLIITLVVSLAGFSLFLAGWYNRQAALSQLPSYSVTQANGNSTEAGMATGEPSAAVRDGNLVAPPPAPPPPSPEVEQPEKTPAPPAANDHPGPLADPQPVPAAQELEATPGNDFPPAPATAADQILPAIAAAATVPPPTVSVNAPQTDAAAQKKVPAPSPAAEPKITHQPPRPSAEEIKKAEPVPKSLPSALSATGKADNAAAVERVINNYQEHYNKRELLSFLSLFAEGATENGQPVASLSDQYRSLFAHTQAISMQIHDINWNPFQSGFQIQGRFNANYTYNDGRSKTHQGDINFTLVSSQGELKIQALDYVFQE